MINEAQRCYYCGSITKSGRFCSNSCIDKTFFISRNDAGPLEKGTCEIKLNDIPNNTNALPLDDGWIYKDDKSITRLCLSCGSPFVIKSPFTGTIRRYCTNKCSQAYRRGVKASVDFNSDAYCIELTSREILELSKINDEANVNNLSYLINLAVSDWLKRYKEKESERYYSGKYKERKEIDKNEASKFLGVSTRMVERYEKEGRLSTRTIRVGRTRKNIYDEGELSRLKSELNAVRVRPKIEQNDISRNESMIKDLFIVSNDPSNGLSASQTSLLSDLGIIQMCCNVYSFTKNSKGIQRLDELIKDPSIRRRVKAHLGLSLNSYCPIELIRYCIGKLGFSLKSRQEQMGDETVMVYSIYPRDIGIVGDNYSIKEDNVFCYSPVKDVADVEQNALPFSDELPARKQQPLLIDGIMEIDFDKWNAIIDNL